MGCFADVNCKYTMKIPDRYLKSRSHTSANLFIFVLSRKYSVKIKDSTFYQNWTKIVVQHGQGSTWYFFYMFYFYQDQQCTKSKKTLKILELCKSLYLFHLFYIKMLGFRKIPLSTSHSEVLRKPPPTLESAHIFME